MAAKKANKAAAKKPTKAATKASTVERALGKSKAAKAPPKAAKREKADLSGLTKRQRIEAVRGAINKELGREVCKMASDDYSSYLLRRPTTITSLDIELGGGLPAAAPSVLVGPDGVGKDYLLWLAMAEQQRLYGEDFCSAVYFTEFKMDKLFMKNMCGFMIGFTEGEIEEIEESRVATGLPSLTPADIDWYRKQIGSPIIIDGVPAEDGFDALLKYVEANTCQIVAVNSIGNLQTYAKEDKDSLREFAQQRNEAALMSKLMPKLSMLLNRGGPDGERSESAIVLINQMRSEDEVKKIPGRPTSAKAKMKPANNSWSLKHGKAIELALYKGVQHRTDDYRTIGRTIDWEITKGKLGTHEGKKGSFDFFYEIGADRIGDLIDTCVKHGVIQRNGSWYSCEGMKASQSDAPIRARIHEDPSFKDQLRDECFAKAGVSCRFK
jgi:RecA/RadA recombinase